MARAVQRFVGVIHARADHFPFINDYASNGSLSERKRFLGHVKSLSHKPQMGWEILTDLHRQITKICRDVFFVRRHEGGKAAADDQ